MSLIDSIAAVSTTREHTKSKTPATTEGQTGAFADEVIKTALPAMSIEEASEVPLGIVSSRNDKTPEAQNVVTLEKDGPEPHPSSAEPLLSARVEQEITSPSSPKVETKKDIGEAELALAQAAVQKDAPEKLMVSPRVESSDMLQPKSADGLHSKESSDTRTKSDVAHPIPIASKPTIPPAAGDTQKAQPAQAVLRKMVVESSPSKKTVPTAAMPTIPTAGTPPQLQREPLKPTLRPNNATDEPVLPLPPVKTTNAGQHMAPVLPTPVFQQSTRTQSALGADIESLSAGNALRSEHVIAIPQNTPSSVSPVIGPATTTTAPPAQQILAHITAADDVTKPTSIDVRLDPEDLGKVRLNFLPRETGFLVVVSAERAETLDLLRRNAEDLKAGLLDMNFEGADLEFSNAPEDTDWGSQEDEVIEQFSAVQAPSATPVLAAANVQTDRLDIRL